jgi:type IV pilus assembly protein PilE
MSAHSRGFTLIELMIVVAVVAILAAIAYPSYQEYIRKSRRAQAKADLVELAQLAERHHTVQNSYSGFSLPFTQSPREGGTAHYGLALNPEVTATSFTIVATPANGQANDRCGTLSLNQAGVKTHSEGPSDCW